MDHSMLYEILYALAALGERKQALFGNCAPAARKAFARSCAGNAFPEIWFDVRDRITLVIHFATIDYD